MDEIKTEKTPYEVQQAKAFWAEWGRKNEQRIADATYCFTEDMRRREAMGMDGYVDSRY